MNIQMKKGFTLVETIIAIGIFTIVIMGTSVFVVKIWESQRFIFQSGLASIQASQGVTNIIKLIRNAQRADNGAYPIVSVDDSDLIMYGDIDNDGVVERLHYYKDSNTIKVGITDPTTDVPPQYPSGDQTVQTIVENVVNTSGEHVFTYYDENNAELSSPVQVNTVKMIKVFLSVDINPSLSPEPVQFESFASIRNLSKHDRIE